MAGSCPYADMSKEELKAAVKRMRFKCDFCGLIHDKIGFFEGFNSESRDFGLSNTKRNVDYSNSFGAFGVLK